MKDLTRCAILEMLMMAIFVYFGCGSALATGELLVQNHVTSHPARLVPIALTFGMTILVLAFMLGHITGGHINPAVTLTLTLSGACEPLRAVVYILAQFFGAVLGSLLLWASTSQMSYDENHKVIETVGSPPYLLGANRLNSTLNQGNGFALEMIGTFTLCLTVLMTVRHKGNMAQGTPCLAPLPIGMAVFIAHVVLVPFTGCGINPARSFGPLFVVGMSDSSVWTKSWIFFVGPAAGAILAAAVFKFIQSTEAKDQSAAVTSNARGTKATSTATEAESMDQTTLSQV